jgi:phosphoribosylformylglycinamidine cyclo-ligase
VRAVLDKSTWPMPPLFRWLQERGNVAESEMHRVFNCGIGMVVVVADRDVTHALRFLQDANETVYRIGTIVACERDQPQTVVI